MTALRLGGRRRPAPRRFPFAMLAALVGIFLLARTDFLRTRPADDSASPATVFATHATSGLRAVRVHDGDTLTVEGPQDGRQRIRVFGIDCPEHGQPYGDEARRLTEHLAKGSELELLPVETDRLGRLVARVKVGDQDLAEELLEAGLAWHFRRYSNDASYQAAEDDARAARRGLWSAPRPTPPWEWRRDHPVDRR